MIAMLLAALFVALALLHFYWAAGVAGAASGGFVPSDGGEPLFTPGPLATGAVGLALLAAAWVVTCRAGLVCLGMPPWMARPGIWLIALLFAARAVGDFRYAGFFKRVRGTRFATRDTWIFSPLCLLIALAAVRVALAG
jgi:hypothetical protein